MLRSVFASGFESIIAAQKPQKAKCGDAWASERVQELATQGIFAEAKRFDPDESLCVCYTDKTY